MHFVELSLDLTYRMEYRIEYLIVKLKVEFLIAMHLKSFTWNACQRIQAHVFNKISRHIFTRESNRSDIENFRSGKFAYYVIFSHFLEICIEATKIAINARHFQLDVDFVLRIAKAFKLYSSHIVKVFNSEFRNSSWYSRHTSSRTNFACMHIYFYIFNESCCESKIFKI